MKKLETLICYIAMIFISPISTGAMNSTIGRDRLSIVLNNNQPCFYMDDKEFTDKLPNISKVSVWLQDLEIYSKTNDPKQGITLYRDMMIKTPKSEESCFALPQSHIKLNTPYNISTSFEMNSDFCLLEKEGKFLVTKVNLVNDPQDTQNTTSVCTQEPFAINRTFLEKISYWFYKIFN